MDGTLNPNVKKKSSILICAHCKEFIYDSEVIKVASMNKYYHKHHYNCQFCGKNNC